MGSGSARTAAALVLLFLAVVVLTVAGFAARPWLPLAASHHGPGVDSVIHFLLYTTGAIFVIGHLVLAAFVWTYGRQPASADPSVRPRTETLWAVVPVLVMTAIAEGGVLVMAMPVWSQMYAPPPADALVVEVDSKQFEWIVRYPGRDGVFGRTAPRFVDGVENPAGLDPADPAGRDDWVFINEMHVPAGRPVRVRLRARDVLHSFAIPAFRIKQDAVPGIQLDVLFTPTVLGRYEIACAELCGLGHYRMRGFVTVQKAGDFEAWEGRQVGWFE